MDTDPMSACGPTQKWADVQSDALMWHDKSRKEWVGHVVKLGEEHMLVDRVEDRGEGWWRLHLTEYRRSDQL